MRERLFKLINVLIICRITIWKNPDQQIVDPKTYLKTLNLIYFIIELI
jgi:hypothetical protein